MRIVYGFLYFNLAYLVPVHDLVENRSEAGIKHGPSVILEVEDGRRLRFPVSLRRGVLHLLADLEAVHFGRLHSGGGCRGVHFLYGFVILRIVKVGKQATKGGIPFLLRRYGIFLGFPILFCLFFSDLQYINRAFLHGRGRGFGKVVSRDTANPFEKVCIIYIVGCEVVASIFVATAGRRLFDAVHDGHLTAHHASDEQVILRIGHHVDTNIEFPTIV